MKLNSLQDRDQDLQKLWARERAIEDMNLTITKQLAAAYYGCATNEWFENKYETALRELMEESVRAAWGEAAEIQFEDGRLFAVLGNKKEKL